MPNPYSLDLDFLVGTIPYTDIPPSRRPRQIAKDIIFRPENRQAAKDYVVPQYERPRKKTIFRRGDSVFIKESGNSIAGVVVDSLKDVYMVETMNGTIRLELQSSLYK